MTDFVRVFGLEWEATNGTYFSFDNQVGSPLVLRAEVYTSNWELVSTYNDSFNILVWATLRNGEFTVQLTDYSPLTTYDPYYSYTRDSAGSIGISLILESIFTLFLISTLTKKLRKKRLK
ncbi:MAG: hypothetical protein ACW97Z_03885 [Candidatus Hodarchaeales archaeon]